MSIEELQDKRKAIYMAWGNDLLPRYKARPQINLLTRLIEWASLVKERKNADED